MNKEETQYFREHWQPNWQDKKYSGWALLDKIAPTDSVLDIGCGTNPLKERLGEQVYGIDPAFDQADKLVTLFVPGQFKFWHNSRSRKTITKISRCNKNWR